MMIWRQAKRMRQLGGWVLAVSLFCLTAVPSQVAAQDSAIGVEIVASGFTAPLAVAEPPDGTGRLFVVDQVGQIRIVDAEGTLLTEPFLDVSDALVNLSPGFDERGLLGFAFHPSYAENGRFFIYYSVPSQPGTPASWNHTSRISAFTVSEQDPDRADPASEQILLEVPQPQGNHNAGALGFGPDGYLYIALGDGGGANDNQMGHVDDWFEGNGGGNGQDVTENLLGSILRIDVDNGEPYGIPADNPFVGRDGLDEIYAYGFRNPFRFSFDRGGEYGLLVGDVGQARYEEVNVVERGGNYGWNVHEGAHCFDASNPEGNPSDCPDIVGAGHPDEGAPLIHPVIEYDNDAVGISVIGGYVYRGSAMPALQGLYLFGDWRGAPGRTGAPIFVATPADEGMWDWEELELDPDADFNQRLLAFGEDQSGELYVLGTSQSGPSGNTGIVYRLVGTGGVAAEGPSEAPRAFTLRQNYPNPFNPSTQIQFELGQGSSISLQVFDALGRHVATLADGFYTAGAHSTVWDATNAAGRAVPSGIYVYQLRTADGVASRTMTLIR